MANYPFDVTIPLRLYSPNVSLHLRAMMSRKKTIRDTIAWHLFNARLQPLASSDRVTITLTRIGGNTMDYDNLVYCFKTVRDAVANALIPGLRPGTADSDIRLTWKYHQEKGKGYHVKISIALS